MRSVRPRARHRVLALLVPIALVLAGAFVGAAGPASAADIAAPTDVTASSSGTTATVTWSPGDDQANFFEIDAIGEGGYSNYVAGDETSVSFTGLLGATAYTFEVVGCSAWQDCGDYSDDSNSVTVLGAPPRPTGVTGYGSTVDGSGQVTVSWDASPSGLGVTGYTVSQVGGSSYSVSSTTLSRTFTGLTPGTAYSFNVSATNGYGTGSGRSTGSVTAPVVPSAPLNVAAIPADGEAIVTWDAPATNANLMAAYWVTTYAGGVPVGDASSALYSSNSHRSMTIGGLTNGTAYTFKVQAHIWGDGISAYSSASSAVTPYAPTGVPNTPNMSGAAPQTGTGGKIDVAWTAPSGASTAAIDHYTVTASPGGATKTVDTSQLTTTFTGLTIGTTYTFTATATNSAGTSSASSASNSVDLGTVPGVPTSVSAEAHTVDGAGQATVTWTAPSTTTNNPPAGYSITCSCGGSPTTVSGGSTTSATITGLTINSPVSFTVKASNYYGAGSASSSSGSVTPPIVPSAPSIFSAVPGDGQVAVSWSAPTTNASLTAVYRVVPYIGTTAQALGCEFLTSGVDSSCTVTGLTNGTAYTFKVQAGRYSGLDSGPWSSSSASVTPYTASVTPNAPQYPYVWAAAPNKATVSWYRPSNWTTAAIDHYTVTASPGGATRTVNASDVSTTFTGLTNGTTYTFTITAVNALGSSSSTTDTIVAGDTPGAPTSVGAEAHTVNGVGQATVGWTAPSSNGGAPITSYTVTASPGGATASASGSATSATVTGLTVGTAYTFTVRATNDAATSAASSASSSVTPPAVPSAPTSVTATAGNGQATVSWGAPATNASLTATYAVEVFSGSTDLGLGCGPYLTSGTASSCTVTGLTNGTAYTFKVQAGRYSGLDSGPWSSASGSVTPHS